MTPSDPELLGRTAAGDAAAFDAFVGRHQGSVFRYLALLARDRADAEDALQEAFVAAWRGAAGFRGGGSARSWLLAVARNALSRLHRRRMGEPDRFEPIDRVDALGVRAGWGSVADPDPLLERLARRELVERALATLPDPERETVVLRDVEGLTGAEVAEVTGVTLAAMKSRLHRGRLRLAASLMELDDA